MKRLESAQDLKVLKEQIQYRLAKNDDKIQIKVHLGTCGISSGADKTLDAFVSEVDKRNLTNVIVSKASCIGLCGKEPIVTIRNPGDERIIYQDITADKVSRIIDQHLLGGHIAEYQADIDSPRFKMQQIRVMKNQDIDPMSIDQYIARNGYQALVMALTELKPDAVLNEIKKSGLKGRGGAGFGTGMKWEFVRNAVGNEKYVVCNGDEGDPGAYMNRAVLEGNPHSIIEGMMIGALAIGNVKQGYAYIRAEYPLAIQTLENAINQAKEYGLLGKNILGTNFEFNLEIFPGAGAFVCGEETALLTSIEGKRGNPHQRPPFPANEGLFGKPTTLNNVETWSNVPQIILNGADWFTKVGGEGCRGTKTLCLVGKVKNTGLIEIPLGISLGDVIFQLGEGVPNDKKFKAVQLGGPSGGVIPAEHLNTPVDYTSISALGAIIGSGGVVVMDEDSCMVDVAKYFLDFTKDESCGKCISCREGNPQMYNLLCKISEGKATMKDLALLEDLSKTVSTASICGLGQTAPNPVLTTLRYFRDEYESHIIDKKCPSAVCQALFKAPCQHTCPVGLDIPAYISLIKEGNFEQAYEVIMQKLPMPMTVGRVCPAPCESKCRRNQVDEAVAIRHLKRFAADYAYEHELSYLPEIKVKRHEKIAIIGSGPAGLSAAWDLAHEGFKVTIFEALSVAGGMLAVGIPEYRLPKKILNYEIENIKKLGVEIKLNKKITDIEQLQKDGFSAALIAVGAHKGLMMNIPGENQEGVIDAIEFLKNINLNSKQVVGDKVAVIGGGNSAIDAARSALRNGAREVYILYRREKVDMPAEKEEIEAAETEGIKILCLTAPTKVIGKNGKVSGVECVKMNLGAFDKSGRRSPVPDERSKYMLDVNMVIEAIGQESDFSSMKLPFNKQTKTRKPIANKRTLMTNFKGVFIAGDAQTGPATVIEAIASGQRAASSIKRYIQGEELTPTIERNGYKPIIISNTPPSEQDTQKKDRTSYKEISNNLRKTNNEVVSSYSEEEAKSESHRCLRCDLETD
jgi:NADH-quinone oxidoreductase subunit F